MALSTDIRNIIFRTVPLKQLQIWCGVNPDDPDQLVRQFLLLGTSSFPHSLFYSLLNMYAGTQNMSVEELNEYVFAPTYALFNNFARFTRAAFLCGDIGYGCNLFADSSLCLIAAIRNNDPELVEYYARRRSSDYNHGKDKFILEEKDADVLKLWAEDSGAYGCAEIMAQLFYMNRELAPKISLSYEAYIANGDNYFKEFILPYFGAWQIRELLRVVNEPMRNEPGYKKFIAICRMLLGDDTLIAPYSALLIVDFLRARVALRPFEREMKNKNTLSLVLYNMAYARYSINNATYLTDCFMIGNPIHLVGLYINSIEGLFNYEELASIGHLQQKKIYNPGDSYEGAALTRRINGESR